MGSLWLSGRALERGIRSSEARFLMEIRIFSLSHARDNTKKHLSLLQLFYPRKIFLWVKFISRVQVKSTFSQKDINFKSSQNTKENVKTEIYNTDVLEKHTVREKASLTHTPFKPAKLV